MSKDNLIPYTAAYLRTGKRHRARRSFLDFGPSSGDHSGRNMTSMVGATSDMATVISGAVIYLEDRRADLLNSTDYTASHSVSELVDEIVGCVFFNTSKVPEELRSACETISSLYQDLVATGGRVYGTDALSGYMADIYHDVVNDGATRGKVLYVTSSLDERFDIIEALAEDSSRKDAAAPMTELERDTSRGVITEEMLNEMIFPTLTAEGAEFLKSFNTVIGFQVGDDTWAQLISQIKALAGNDFSKSIIALNTSVCGVPFGG